MRTIFAVLVLWLSCGPVFAVTNYSIIVTDGTNSFWLASPPQIGQVLSFSSTGFAYVATGGGGDVTTAQLNTASNAVYAAKQNTTANLDQWSSIGTNWNWNALHTNALTAKAAHTDLVTSSNVLNSAIVANDTTTSNGVVAYANGVTNSSIARQAEMTALSNTLNSAITAATNAPQVTNWINFRQPATPALTNLSGNPNVVTQILAGANATVTSNNAGVFTIIASGFITTNLVRTVLGAGSGNTNYLLPLFTNSVNEFYLGSSNVNLYTVSGSTLGAPIWFNAYVTNLSAINWGIRFQSGTNRWLFSSFGNTNSPSVLTNNTRLHLRGRADGTNIMVEWAYYRPAF